MKFKINLMHSITNGNYGLLLDDNITINIRPYYKTRNTSHPDFSYSKIYWTTLIVHESAHGFVNPLVKKYRNEIEKIDIKLYQEKLKELCYGDDLETFINENIIRALECLYVKENFEDSYNQYLNDNLEDRYEKIPEIIELIKDTNYQNLDILTIIKLFNKKLLSFHIPSLEEMSFRQKLLADEETMSYNAKWGSTINFPKEKWEITYKRLINENDKNFYAYLYSNKQKCFIGEVGYWYDEEVGEFITNILIHAKYRNKGYRTIALTMLCDLAKKKGISFLSDTIALDNPSISIFLKQGFREVMRTNEYILIKKRIIK